MSKLLLSVVFCILLLMLLAFLVIYFSWRRKAALNRALCIFKDANLQWNGESKYLNFGIYSGDVGAFYCAEFEPIWYFACLKESSGGGFQKWCWCSISPSNYGDISLISDGYKLYHPNMSKIKGGARDYGEIFQGFRVFGVRDRSRIINFRNQVGVDNYSIEIKSGMLLCMMYVERYSKESFDEFVVLMRTSRKIFN